LGLSTSCPIWRGYLSDVDSRWNILSQTTDDRTKEEIENNIYNSSRYSSVSNYLSETSEIYNDIQLNIDQHVYQTLLQNGFVFFIKYFIFNKLFLLRLSINTCSTFC